MIIIITEQLKMIGPLFKVLDQFTATCPTPGDVLLS